MNGQQNETALTNLAVKGVIPMVLLLGAVVRIVVWLQNRALFHDEANLALNFCEKSFFDFFQPLDHDQFAPPLFSMVEKCSVLFLGNQEYALRLFPLLCGLASIPLFYGLARRLMTNAWVLLASVWLFSFSEILLRYTTEAKQYGCDILVALLLVRLALWQNERPFRAIPAAIAGMTAIWLSMPAVFVLSGIGLYYLFDFWQQKNKRAFGSTMLAIGCWVISFGIYYWMLLKPSQESQNLVASHSPWFLPLFPTDAAQWGQWRDLLLSFPRYTAGFTVLALTCGSAGILTGIVCLFRKRKQEAFLLVVPVLACLLASALRQYSLMPRLIVWTFPLLMLCQGLGWQLWWTATHRYLRPVLLLLWCSTAGLQMSWQYLVKPYTLEEIRTVLDTVRSGFVPGDVLFADHEARPALAYYRQCHVQKDLYRFDDLVVYADWNVRPEQGNLSVSGKMPRRLWLVYSHVVSDLTRTRMQQDLDIVSRFARQVRVVEAPGAYAFLFEL